MGKGVEMKVTVDRKTLANNLKLLQRLSSEAPKSEQERFRDTVLLRATDKGLSLAAGFGQAILCATIPTEVKEKGECVLSYKLYDMVKASRDNTLVLSKKVKLSISGEDTGFSGTLTEKIGAGFPVSVVEEMVAKGVKSSSLFYTEELSNLINLSNVFSPMGNWRYIEITVTPDESNATVQGSEEGTLDCFPMQVEGDDVFLRMHPDYLKPLLSFCGERVRIQTLNVNAGFLLITDPDNDDWWATMVQIGKNEQERYGQ